MKEKIGAELTTSEQNSGAGDSQMYSEEVELKNGLREHLATTTEALMDELMAMLRNESSTF